MDFIAYISTPKDTLETDPLISHLRLTKGRITGGTLFFPPGPAGTLHLIARMGEHQIIPFNTGQNYLLDDVTIDLNINLDLSQPPYVLDIITWNDSTSYPHVLTLTLFMDPWKPLRKHKSITQKLLDQVKGYQKR